MANIDWGTLALGALVGMGCRKQLKSCGRIAASTAASLAGAAAQAVAEVAKETQKTEKSPEEAAAQQWLNRMDYQMSQSGTQAVQNGQKNG